MWETKRQASHLKSTYAFALVLLTVFIWTSCGPKAVGYVQFNSVAVSSEIKPDQAVDYIIAPYREQLAEEMSRVISFAPQSIERNKPEGSLGNLVTDLTIAYLEEYSLLSPSLPKVCVMNHGGLRSSIGEGAVTVESIFKLMPFDNSIVVLKVGPSTIDALVAYMRKSGGEPLSGLSITPDGYEFWDANLSTDTIALISTNYLVGGGDNMLFFENHFEKEDTGILLRDLLIEMIDKKDTLAAIVDGRIQLD